MTYSGGTSYEVGDIYDQKISQFYDTKTEILVHFTENGMVDECGNEWQYVHDNITDTMANVPTQDCIFGGSLASNSETFANAGCKMSNLTSGNIYLTKEITLGGSEPFMIDCWVRCNDIPAVASSQVGKSIWSYYIDGAAKGFHLANRLNCKAGGFTTGSSCMTIDTFFGGSSQTLTYLFGTGSSKNTSMRNLSYYNIYYRPSADGSLSLVFFQVTSGIVTANNAKATWRHQAGAQLDTITLKDLTFWGNNGRGHHSDIAEFRVIRGKLESYTPQSSGSWGIMPCPTEPKRLLAPTGGLPVGGNLPIRHNNQTYYAPLISDANYKSSPCIAVRHNNQTYYTVK